jgi:hypothetical protein
MIFYYYDIIIKMDKSLEELIEFCKENKVNYLNKDKNPKPLTKRHIIINLRKEGYIDNKDNLKTYIYRGGIRIILVNSYKIESSNISVATISFS